MDSIFWVVVSFPLVEMEKLWAPYRLWCCGWKSSFLILNHFLFVCCIAFTRRESSLSSCQYWGEFPEFLKGTVNDHFEACHSTPQKTHYVPLECGSLTDATIATISEYANSYPFKQNGDWNCPVEIAVVNSALTWASWLQHELFRAFALGFPKFCGSCSHCLSKQFTNVVIGFEIFVQLTDLIIALIHFT